MTTLASNCESAAPGRRGDRSLQSPTRYPSIPKSARLRPEFDLCLPGFSPRHTVARVDLWQTPEAHRCGMGLRSGPRSRRPLETLVRYQVRSAPSAVPETHHRRRESHEGVAHLATGARATTNRCTRHATGSSAPNRTGAETQSGKGRRPGRLRCDVRRRGGTAGRQVRGGVAYQVRRGRSVRQTARSHQITPMLSTSSPQHIPGMATQLGTAG